MYADLVLLNGEIITFCETKPFAEAIAVKSGKILDVGLNVEIKRYVGENTKVIDLKGKTAIPGLIDSHIHVGDLAKTLSWIDLHEAKSIEEIKKLIGERVKNTRKGKWIIGKGWDERKLAEKRMPSLSDIDEVAPENPVVLYRAEGKICVVNSAALQIVGKSINLSKLEGSLRIKGSQNCEEMKGVLYNSATDFVWELIPEMDVEELAELIKIAFDRILEAGITTVQWIATSLQEAYALVKFIKRGNVPLRIYLLLPMDVLKTPGLLQELEAFEDEYFKVGGVIFSVDGYLATKTAALTKPYMNSKDRGKLFHNSEDIAELIEKIGKLGLQVAIHAMGDRAIKETLKAIEENELSEKRFRLETAALLTPKLIRKIAKLKSVIVSIQPYMAYSELTVWKAVENLGPRRIRWLYPLKTLFEKGIIVAGGTDSPMEPLNIFSHIKAAVTWIQRERIEIYDALKMYTLNAAHAMCAEKMKGSIEISKLADITVLSENPLTTKKEKIDEIKIEFTMVGGKIVYLNPSSDIEIQS